jgi:hypothetical protein
MIRTSVAKYRENKDKCTSHCNVAEASIIWCQKSAKIHKSCARFAVEFCVSVSYVLRKYFWSKNV